MKKLIYLLITSVILLACNSEDANDCFQTSGAIVQQEFDVSTFSRILVNRDVELILKQGVIYKVVIETGRNLLNDVDARIVGDQLQLTDGNTCNFVRDFGITKVYVTAPDITEIRSSTQFDISSDGVLNYDSLVLLSEDFNAPNSFTVGDFKLNVNLNELRIVSNNLSSFFIKGQVENLDVGFFAGTGRFEGEHLIAQNVDVLHRGSNDMIVNPQQSLIGQLFSTGNLISKNEPPIVEVEELYIGKLIFED